MIEALSDRPDRRRLVTATAAAARAELDRLAGQGLRWGVRHGDPSLDNLHLDADGLHWYDLDLAGPGWQVEDLTGAMSTAFAGPFLAGYTAVRTLPAVETEALGWLGLLATIDNLKFHLVDKPGVLGTASLAEGWVDRGFEQLLRTARDAGVAVPDG